MAVASWVLTTTSLSSASRNFEGYSGRFGAIANDRCRSRPVLRGSHVRKMRRPATSRHSTCRNILRIAVIRISLHE
jgi:hypothetical protein